MKKMDTAHSFPVLMKTIGRAILFEGDPIDTGHWQALKDVPNTKTIELTNVDLEIPIPPTIKELQEAIKPNLPWAEAQFQDRVSGKALNPPPSHKLWPWARHNDQHQVYVEPELDERDWAYLAALIDGDGHIALRVGGKKNKGRPAIYITQRDEAYLRRTKERFGVGTICVTESKSGFGSESQTRWAISAKAEVSWVLKHIVKYLDLKRPSGEEALELLDTHLPLGRPPNPFGEMGEPRFSHSYPERIWPPRGYGIRFPPGNLNNLLGLLAREPYTRQAYLPIWHAEDLYAADVGRERVPCSLGYHFLLRDNKLHCTYFIRSCDFLRYMADDAYMAARLTQWILSEFQAFEEGDPMADVWEGVQPGNLSMHIVSLHVFEGDLQKMRKLYG